LFLTRILFNIHVEWDVWLDCRNHTRTNAKKDSLRVIEVNKNGLPNTYTFQQDLFQPSSPEEARKEGFVCPDLPEKGALRVAEMFSGPGGIGIALNRTKTERFSFEHVWATDYDADTMQTYKTNVLKDSKAPFFLSDIRKLDIDKLPPADGFLYGFPCNDFSKVGESKGFDGNYGGLYSYGVKYLNRVNPLFFMAENVTGISSVHSGKAFDRILSELNHAGVYGYNVTVHLYKFEKYGVPQARHRYIIVGIRGDLGKTFGVPAPTLRQRSCREAIENPPIPQEAANNERAMQSKRVIARLNLIKPGENIWMAESRLPDELKLNVKGARLSQIYRRLDPDLPSYTITGSGGGGTHVYHWSEPRALTNRERARLQTFPDDFVFTGGKESVRRQIGMAVPCDGAQIILKAILQTLEGQEYATVDPSVGCFPAKSFSISARTEK
jgi:DNA (cytosine-5)-methyltransferase 1